MAMARVRAFVAGFIRGWFVRDLTGDALSLSKRFMRAAVNRVARGDGDSGKQRIRGNLSGLLGNSAASDWRVRFIESILIAKGVSCTRFQTCNCYAANRFG